MQDEPVYQKVLNPTSFIKVYKNRVVIKQQTGLFSKSEETILLRNITSVELSGMTKKLRIITPGKTYEAPWAVGKTAEEVRQAILSQL